MELRDDFLSRLRDAKSILFFTGAGISAESGIATFRGENGLWNKLKPEELASFDRNGVDINVAAGIQRFVVGIGSRGIGYLDYAFTVARNGPVGKDSLG